MSTKFRAAKKSISISACIIVLLLIVGGFTIKAILNTTAPELIKYNSQQYQYVNIAEGELLESAKKNTKSTGKFIGSMEIYTYDSDSNLLYLKEKCGEYLLYHTIPLP